MLGSIYLPAVSWLLLSLAQRAVLQQEETNDLCPILTKNSMKIVCKADDERQPCQEVGVNSTVSILWNKKIIKNNTSTDELVCQSTGEWKKKQVSKFVPLGYTELPNFGYYKVYNLELAWMNALLHCLADGTHMVVIDSKKELAALNTILASDLPQTKDVRLHIGATDLLKEGKFVTIFGARFETGDLKVIAEGGEVENCVLMQAWDSKLFDAGCTQKRPFICEAPRTRFDVTINSEDEQ